MKAKIEKDLRYRSYFKKNESLALPIRALLKNEKLSKQLRESLYIGQPNTPDKRNKIRNRCVLTARSRSVIRFFSLSRIKFRELALKGLLFGIKKSSW
jgi:small subunit ribosomal protein S14